MQRSRSRSRLRVPVPVPVPVILRSEVKKEKVKYAMFTGVQTERERTCTRGREGNGNAIGNGTVAAGRSHVFTWLQDFEKGFEGVMKEFSKIISKGFEEEVSDWFLKGF